MRKPLIHLELFDFAPRSLSKRMRRIDILFWCSLVTIMSIVNYIAYTATKSYQHSEVQKTEITRLNAQIKQQASKQILTTQQVLPPEELAMQSDIAEELNTPWSDFFDLIESETKDIAVLTIEPQLKQEKIKLTAEAPSRGEMTAYLKKLERRPSILNVALYGFDVNQVDPAKPVRFQFEIQRNRKRP